MWRPRVGSHRGLRRWFLRSGTRLTQLPPRKLGTSGSNTWRRGRCVCLEAAAQRTSQARRPIRRWRRSLRQASSVSEQGRPARLRWPLFDGFPRIRGVRRARSRLLGPLPQPSVGGRQSTSAVGWNRASAHRVEDSVEVSNRIPWQQGRPASYRGRARAHRAPALQLRLAPRDCSQRCRKAAPSGTYLGLLGSTHGRLADSESRTRATNDS